MSRVDTIEKEVCKLSPRKLTAFREWFARYDAEAWEKQLEADIKAGRLDQLAEESLADHEAGKSRKL